MSIKSVKKENLVYKDGYILNKKGEVVTLSDEVVHELNALERIYQQAKYNQDKLNSIKKAKEAGCDIPDFEFRSEHKDTIIMKEPKTPKLDKQCEESMEIVAELRAKDDYNNASKIAEKYSYVNEFVNNDPVFIGTDPDCLERLDLSMIGNPLTLTATSLSKIYAFIAEYDGENCCRALGIDPKDLIGKCVCVGI